MAKKSLLLKLQLRIRAAKKEARFQAKHKIENPSAEFWRGFIEACELARNDVLDEQENASECLIVNQK